MLVSATFKYAADTGRAIAFELIYRRLEEKLGRDLIADTLQMVKKISGNLRE